VSQQASPDAPGVIAGLVAAAHPGPAMVVTAMATALAVALEAGTGTTVLIALAFGSGQLSIGWSNDWIDAARDTATGRTDKPVARGAVAATTVARAAAVAAALTVPLSLALGLAAGIAHLVAVAAAWSYNLGLKSTVWSWAPYALAFGLVPAVVVLALPGHPSPPVWLVGVGALLGTGAHLANVLPDLEDDRVTGVRAGGSSAGPGRSRAAHHRRAGRRRGLGCAGWAAPGTAGRDRRHRGRGPAAHPVRSIDPVRMHLLRADPTVHDS
jgi:4-hydroxybenzoate polyprenyltransferase